MSLWLLCMYFALQPTDVHTTPVNKKTSTSAASDASTPTNKKTPASAASYRSFLNREGPKSLGSKEVPQVCFVIQLNSVDQLQT